MARAGGGAAGGGAPRGGASRGVFITLEGIDGVGKTTQAQLLAAWLRRLGQKVVLTREPGGSEGGRRIAQLLATPPAAAPWPVLAETLLYYAARADHIRHVIAPSLAAGAWVVCDRFADSSNAYQGGDATVTTPLLNALDKAVLSCAPKLTFLLDLAVAESRRRRVMRPLSFSAIAEPEDETLEDVRRRFLKIASNAPERCVLLDAAAGVREVHEKMTAILRARLSSRFAAETPVLGRAEGSLCP